MGSLDIDVILKKKYNHAFEWHKYMGYPIVCCLYMPVARSKKGGFLVARRDNAH